MSLFFPYSEEFYIEIGILSFIHFPHPFLILSYLGGIHCVYPFRPGTFAGRFEFTLRRLIAAFLRPHLTRTVDLDFFPPPSFEISASPFFTTCYPSGCILYLDRHGPPMFFERSVLVFSLGCFPPCSLPVCGGTSFPGKDFPLDAVPAKYRGTQTSAPI